MTFASAITEKGMLGSIHVRTGTFTNGAGDSGGNIDTGLGTCILLELQHTGDSVVAKDPVVNETLPIDGSAVTIVTETGADGVWLAHGWL